jgi:hypothetical protein
MENITEQEVREIKMYHLYATVRDILGLTRKEPGLSLRGIAYAIIDELKSEEVESLIKELHDIKNPLSTRKTSQYHKSTSSFLRQRKRSK